MMTWRPYLWGDNEAVNGKHLKTELVPYARTLVDEKGEIHALGGLIPTAPGTYEVFLAPSNGRVSSFEVYRAIRQKFLDFAFSDGVCRLIAFVDPRTEKGAELAISVGMKREAFLPAWWDGEPRMLMGRVCK